MKFAKIKFSSLVVAAGIAVLSTWAAQAIASEAGVLNAAVGSFSDSMNGSSKSIQNMATESGSYRVIQVAPAPNRSGFMQMTLRSVKAQDAAEDVVLTLTQISLNSSSLTKGDLVAVRVRAYGMEFVNALNKAAFFLVMHDASFRELANRPIAL